MLPVAVSFIRDNYAMNLHILDNGYNNRSSHHVEYTNSVCKEWRSRGGAATIYSCKAGDVIASTDIVPVFSHPFYNKIVPFPMPTFLYGILEIIYCNLSYLVDIIKIERSRFTSGDIVFVHTLNHGQLVALFVWFKLFMNSKKVHIVTLLRYSNIVPGKTAVRLNSYWFYRIFFRLSDLLRPWDYFHLATDSADLLNEYQSYTKSPVTLLPIPHVPTFIDKKTDNSPTTSFIYLGSAREEKGYGLLPEAIRIVTQDHGLKNVHFVIQSTLPECPGAGILDAKQKLTQMPAFVTIIDRALSSGEYYDLMAASDVVLIPYRTYYYHSQTSGIFTEALAMGKCVIVTKETWMARQIMGLGGGGIFVDDNSPSSFAEAIKRFHENRLIYEQQINRVSNQWRLNHNPANFVERLASLVGKDIFSERSGIDQ